MDQTNNNQPMQPTTPPVEPVTTPNVPPPTAPSQPAPLPNQIPTPPVNQSAIPATPPVIPPQPTKRSAMPLVIGAVIVFLLAIGVASFVLFSKNKAQTSQVTTAKTTVVATPTPNQNTVKQIQAVDSSASDSSDLQDLQSNINQL